jgi:hypothetical protein
VAFEMKWEPGIISRLFLDNRDYNGLFYWHDAIVEMNKEIEKITKKK